MFIYKVFIKDLFLDVVWEILYFPLWWYSRGLKNTGFFCLRKIKDAWRFSALSIILHSFFKPMFAQRGWDAYVLTLMVRCWQVFWRFVGMSIFSIFWFCIFLAWIILPIFIIYKLFS